MGLMLDPDLVMPLKLPENMAPLLTRTPGGVDAREELGLPGEAKLSAEVVARRTVLPRRARARATRATRLEGRAASSRGRPSSRGGPPRPPRGSSRGADVDSSPSQSPTGARTGMPLPSAMLDVASRIRLNPSLLNSQVLSLQ